MGNLRQGAGARESRPASRGVGGEGVAHGQGERESTLSSTGNALAPKEQGHWKRERGQRDSLDQASRQVVGRGKTKR